MLPLTIEITDLNGRQWRPPFRNLKYAKVFQGGEDLWLAFILDRDSSQDYPDIGYGYDVVLRNGLEPRFRGEIRQIESDLETVTVKVLGMWVHLDDYGYGGAGKLWADSRYGKWKVGTNDHQPAFCPERFEMDAHDRLYMSPKKGRVIGTPNHSSAAWYYLCPYQNIQRISWDYDFVDPDHWWFILGTYNADWTGGALIWNTQATSSGVKDIEFAIPKPLIRFSLYYSQPEVQFTGETGEDCYLKITNLRLWGEDGTFSRAIECPSVSHIAEDVVQQVGAPTTPISADDELVQESIYVRDTFPDIGASLDARNPDISKERAWWSEPLGNWDIQAPGEANVVAEPAVAVIDAGVSDGVVRVDATTAGADAQYPGLVFRYVDLDNYWLLLMDPFGWPPKLQLWKIVPGPDTLVVDLTLGVQLGFTYNLMVKLRGPQIDCYLGGIWRCDTNDPFNQTATLHGMRATHQTGLRFDNFEVFQGLPLWPLFYERGQSCHRALVDAGSYGDWDFRDLGWGIEPGGSRLYLRRADRSRVRYVIPPYHASRLSARGQTDKGFVTEAWGQFIDEDGVERLTAKYYAHVTATGIVANTTPPAAGDSSAENVYGVKRERTINFGREDAGLAVEYLRQYLEEHAHPQVKSSFEIFGPVQDRFKGGAWIQPYEMEMGYVVQIPYFRATEAVGVTGSDIRWDVGGGSDTTFLLAAMRYDVERGMAKLIPEGASEDLERLMKYSRDVERAQEKSLIDKRREASFSR